MKKIVFFDPAPPFNCVRITSPAEGVSIEDVIKRLPKSATDIKEVDAKDLPTDRTFRNAWKADLSVDMPKARNLWRDKMRVARVSKIEALDIAYQRADERGDNAEKAKIAGEKQKLRDVTADPAIESAKTPEELKAVWPPELG